MHIDKYKQEDGSYIDAEGCHHDDAESFLQCHVLGFCGCGAPQDALEYVRGALRHTANLKLVHENVSTHRKGDAWSVAWDAWDKAGKALMGNADWFTRYWMDKERLTEHGSSVGGAWLTEKGSQLLDDLDELLSGGGGAEPVGDDNATQHSGSGSQNVRISNDAP